MLLPPTYQNARATSSDGGDGGGGDAGSSGGGMLSGLIAMACARADRIKSQIQNALPPATPPQVLMAINGMTPPQIMGAVALVAGCGVYYASSWVPLPVVGLLAMVIILSTQTEGGKRGLQSVAGKLSSTSGRPISSTMLLFLICACIALLGRQLLGGRGMQGFPGMGGGGSGSAENVIDDPAEAYQRGYKDGKKRLDYNHNNLKFRYSGGGAGFDDAAASSGGGSGFGFSKLMRYGFIANSVYRLGNNGAGGWSVAAAIANAKASPMQAAFIAMMLMS